MANAENLKPFTGADDPRRLNGRPKGIPNRKTILNWLLFEADINQMGVITNRPSWYDAVSPKNLYEVMTIAMATKAMSGDSQAYQALNKALGDRVDLTSDDKPIAIMGGLSVVQDNDSDQQDIPAS